MRRALGGFLAALLAVAGLSLAGGASPAGAIVGGSEASRDYPFMTQLYLKQSDSSAFSFACGASLVRPGYVLTAAHCVTNSDTFDPLPAGEVRVHLGRRKLSDGGGETPPVTQVIVNEGYKPSGGATHDIALLRLGTNATAAPIRIVGLDERAVWAPGVAATVIGWGTTSSGGNTSDTLREVRVPIRSDQECQSTVGTTAGYDPATNLCAGETLGGGDSCQGDSGGPLMAPDAAGRLTQVGVVSFGLGCAYPTQYGVYARLGDRELGDWLATRLPAEGASAGGTGAGSGTGGDSGSVTSPASPIATRISYRRALGSVRRPLRIRLTVTAPLRKLTVTLRRGSKVVARGRRASLRSGGTVALRRRGARRAGTVRVTITARDADGALVRRTGTARLSR